MSTSLNEDFTEWILHWMSISLNDYFPEWGLRWMSTWLNEYFTEWVLHWMSTSLNEYFTEWVLHWMSTLLNEYITEWVLHWMSTSLNEYFTEWVRHWMSTSLNEYFNEWVLQWMSTSRFLWGSDPATCGSLKLKTLKSPVARILWSFFLNHFTLYLYQILKFLFWIPNHQNNLTCLFNLTEWNNLKFGVFIIDFFRSLKYVSICSK